MIARMRKPVWLIVFVGAFIGLVVWPLLSLPANVFSLGYFRFYVILTFIILIIAAAIGIFLPIWEARGTVTKLFQWQARTAQHDPNPLLLLCSTVPCVCCMTTPPPTIAVDTDMRALAPAGVQRVCGAQLRGRLAQRQGRLAQRRQRVHCTGGQGAGTSR